MESDRGLGPLYVPPLPGICRDVQQQLASVFFFFLIIYMPIPLWVSLLSASVKVSTCAASFSLAWMRNPGVGEKRERGVCVCEESVLWVRLFFFLPRARAHAPSNFTAPPPRTVLSHECHCAVAVRDVAVLVGALNDLVGQGHPEAQVVQALAHGLCVLIPGVVLEHGLQEVVHLPRVAEVIHAPRGSHHVQELLHIQLDACKGGRVCTRMCKCAV